MWMHVWEYNVTIIMQTQFVHVQGQQWKAPSPLQLIHHLWRNNTFMHTKSHSVDSHFHSFGTVLYYRYVQIGVTVYWLIDLGGATLSKCIIILNVYRLCVCKCVIAIVPCVLSNIQIFVFTKFTHSLTNTFIVAYSFNRI